MGKEIITESRKRVGARLKQIREEYGWTIEQVATMADVKPVTIGKIEEGVFNVPLDILARVAEVLDSELVIRERKYLWQRR